MDELNYLYSLIPVWLSLALHWSIAKNHSVCWVSMTPPGVMLAPCHPPQWMFALRNRQYPNFYRPTHVVGPTNNKEITFVLVYLPCAFPYKGQRILMKCTVQVSSRNFLYVPCPLLLIRPHLSRDSFQKVGLLARPTGGAVEKNGQLVSPVTTIRINFLKLFL